MLYFVGLFVTKSTAAMLLAGTVAVPLYLFSKPVMHSSVPPSVLPVERR